MGFNSAFKGLMSFYIDISCRMKALVRRKAVGITVMNTATLPVLTAVSLIFCEVTVLIDKRLLTFRRIVVLSKRL